MSTWRQLKTVEITGTNAIDGRKYCIREDITELFVVDWLGSGEYRIFEFSGKFSDVGTELWSQKSA